MMNFSFSEQEVVVKGEYDLGATLTIPKTTHQKCPAVVIIGGTGKANRDGNMKNFNMNIYKQLAEFLTGLGFVTIRYDKRGIAQSKGDSYKTGVHDLVQDIISNVKYLETLPYVDHDKILLLGHSEGSILATMANTKHPVAGLILIAGAGISIKTALQAQNQRVIDELKVMKGIKGKLLRLLLSENKLVTKQTKLFERVLASTDDVIRIQLLKFPAKWLREHLSYTDNDVLKMLKNATCPTLAVTGDRDVQADAKDLENVKALQKDNIHCSVIKNMDHVLREYTGVKSVLDIKKIYKNQFNKPLHEQLKEEIKVWYENNFMG